MSFELPPLPYDKHELEPHISAETLEYHHGKHHNAYVTNLNNLIPGTEFEGKTLEQIIQSSSGPIFNNAAQVWNHSFYWKCLSPLGGGKPSGRLENALEHAFGSVDAFKEEFTKCAATTFGSGWAWLVQNMSDAKLQIVSTSNADTPLAHSQVPLLTCDVWEHAYYIDYRNARPKYIEAFWNCVDWTYVGSQLR